MNPPLFAYHLSNSLPNLVCQRHLRTFFPCPFASESIEHLAGSEKSRNSWVSPCFVRSVILNAKWKPTNRMVGSTSIRDAVPLYVTLLVFGGQIGLPVFVATMLLSSKVKRHGSLINFCATWIIYSVVYCLTYVSITFPVGLLSWQQTVYTKGIGILKTPSHWRAELKRYLCMVLCLCVFRLSEGIE